MSPVAVNPVTGGGTPEGGKESSPAGVRYAGEIDICYHPIQGIRVGCPEATNEACLFFQFKRNRQVEESNSRQGREGPDAPESGRGIPVGF